MSVSRRKFLKASAVMSAAWVLKPGTFVLGRDSHRANSLNAARGNTYRREMFEPYIGDVFRVRVGKQMVDLKLVALETAPPASSEITTGKITRTDCFSLRFHAAKPLPAAARSHNLNHGKLGSFELFMVQAENGSHYLNTAIVNHVV